MALRKMMRVASDTYQLEQGWVDIPNNVSPKTLWQEYKATNPPNWPPQSYDQALTLQQQFAQWLHTVKGYTVFTEETLVFK
jgi:hypothetical protein